MYTIALLAVLVILFFRNIKKFQVVHIFPAALIFVISLAVKTVTDDPIDNGYILFICCLLLFPLIASEKEKEYDFYTLILFFSLGIITAALSAQQLVIFPTISRYITVHSYDSITRLSGYYGDPNFYSAHITAAIAGILVLVLNEAKLSRRIILYILMAVLVYCGFLSVSKSFILLFICMLLFWIIEVLFRKGKVSSKLVMIMVLFIGGAFILSSILFTDLIDMIIGRFLKDKTISDFTTRRTEVWNSYFRSFEDNPVTLFFGKGFTDVLVNNRASHNIIIQAIYQFGIPGAVLLLMWFFAYAKNVIKRIHIKITHIVQIFMLVLGAFGPWLAIDSLKFDEFFIMPFVVFIGIIYTVNSTVDPGNVEDDNEIE
jgi:O-antigen ligase